MDTLQENFLKLKFKKSKNQPHAYTESKITMALYQKWKEIQGLSEPIIEDDAKAQIQIEQMIEKVIESDIIEMTGEQLQKFI